MKVRMKKAPPPEKDKRKKGNLSFFLFLDSALPMVLIAGCRMEEVVVPYRYEIFIYVLFKIFNRANDLLQNYKAG